ncbi:hypothetical protein [Anaerovorax odorimutans]|uniref:hypothetical protein n=1 Tax=Anaerovorax odorimutans TaxID=109327 RepID=UPI0012EBDD71|nr:hypothetical protein [Anaerovorax odorimutans]
MALLLAGCQKEQEADDTNTLSQNNISETDSIDPAEMIGDSGIQNDGAMDRYLTSFESQLEAIGLKLEDKAVKDAVSIGALEGYGFNINGSPLEVYLFDPTSSDEKTKENLKTAEESGYITIFGVEINGKTPKANCTFHDSLVLIFPAEDYGMTHPDKEAIIQAFMGIS